MGLFDKLRATLSKTRTSLTGQLAGIFTGRRRIDDELYAELEEALLTADVGVSATEWLLAGLAKEARRRKLETAEDLWPVLQELVEQVLMDTVTPASAASGDPPIVVLFVGVNGAGKTTAIGKMAHRLGSQGKRVLCAAGDTYRAAAREQLEVWARRAQADFIGRPGTDAAAVMFDAMTAAKARGVDVVLCDTAGRLQNKKGLMDELNKVYRVIGREMPGAPHEVLLVLDATVGQNAVAQAKQFKEAAQVTGIVLTKLDGSAKGGVVLAVAREVGIPVKWVGTGEGPDDLEPFDASEFARALFSAEGV
ncbi:MAG: signal recognition particle-docking protein FtsY [Firmicutes bacterium]|nr:signal recognition particle-docking protein FtsY [Bacillota bacterium]